MVTLKGKNWKINKVSWEMNYFECPILKQSATLHRGIRNTKPVVKLFYCFIPLWYRALALALALASWYCRTQCISFSWRGGFMGYSKLLTKKWYSKINVLHNGNRSNSWPNGRHFPYQKSLRENLPGKYRTRSNTLCSWMCAFLICMTSLYRSSEWVRTWVRRFSCSSSSPTFQHSA